MMHKIWTIARREYGAMVVTKAFLLSITLMPILMFGGIVVANRLKDVRDLSDKSIVIVDGSGGALFDELQQVAGARNALQSVAGAVSGARSSKVLLQRYPADSLSDEDRYTLSDRVRKDEIEAFVEIPAGAEQAAPTPPPGPVKFYAQNPMLSAEKGWIDEAVNNTVTARRVKAMNLDAEAVKQATARVRVVPLGLYKKSSGGQILASEESRNAAGIFLPFGCMMLMFMVIMLSAQPMLECVFEEKTNRIAEVLLGSANPFQLMLGKLLGNVAGSLSIVAIYALGGFFVAVRNGWTDMIPLQLIPWFLAYQILAVLLFSSIFMAVGAAVNQLKEAQTMLLPVWLLAVFPLFVWFQIVREPNGAIATWLSFFPPATPFVTVMRLASDAVVPIWQIVTGWVLLLAAAGLCVYLAGRVFRTAILWQGKTPRLRELLRWAWQG